MEENAKAGGLRRSPVKQSGARSKGRRAAPKPQSAHPWQKIYPHGLDWEMPFQAGLLTEMFDSAIAAYGPRACTYFVGRRLSYATIGEACDKAAKGLQAFGVGPGVKVGLLLPNTPSYIIYYFAVLKAGGTVVNFNPLYSVEEIAGQIRDSGTEIMVTLDLAFTFDKVEALLRGGVLKRAVVASFAALLPPFKGAALRLFGRGVLAKPHRSDVADKIIPEAALLANSGDTNPPETKPHDVAVLQYTGGTTGVPKGAMLSHANLTTNIEQVKAWWQHGAATEASESQDRIIAVLPFFHVFAMTAVMNFGLSEGMELILLPKFDLAETLGLISKLKPTMMPGVPTLFGAMMRSPNIAKYDLTSLQFCISGGAPLPIEIKRGFEEIAGCHLVEGYGLSETSPVATCNPLGRAPKEGSIGIPLPGTEVEIHSLEKPGEKMPLGEPGEICIAGPQVMQGYWQCSDETETCFSGRFFRTGDVGFMDEEGYIFIVDRIKDMINASGFKIYPRRIEDALYAHPAVEEATVIGIPDPYRGEAPKAFVKLKQGHLPEPEELLAFLKEKLSKLELPAEIEFRESLPKTMVGKLSKKELVQEAKAKAAKIMAAEAEAAKAEEAALRQSHPLHG